MISASNLSMRFGAKMLFRPCNFQLNPGQHYGLVGANGSGKSTLIKVMTGEVSPESGDIAIANLTKLGTLKQNHYLYEEVPILHVVMMGKEKLWKALQDKDILLEHEHFTEEECHKLDDFEKIIAAEDGYTAESEAATLLEGLGIGNAVHLKPMKVLSGGYKLRVLLAQVLFSRPDVLLLDEPTNHLDLHSIRWLEGYLKDFPGTILLSSHDRDFLNGTCNHIIDLDHETIKIYKGNFENFIETKTEERLLKEAAYEKQGRKRDDLQEFVDRFKAKASKARQAASKMKLVEKMEAQMDSMDFTPSSRLYPHLRFAQVRPAGQIVLKVNNVSKSYGEKRVLHGVSFEIERGERVALLGANGIGKSTLLEILTGNSQVNEGSFQWGHATFPSYFPQDHKREVHGKQNLVDWLNQYDGQVGEQKLREILGRVLFSGDEVKKDVNVLSGGETARLILAKMMLQKHNVLIFDEPTNHLDMESIEALLEALESYDGTVIFVSHNRHFVSSFAGRIIELAEDGVHDYKTTYAEYLEKRDFDLLAAQKRPKAVKEQPVKAAPPPPPPRVNKGKQDKKIAAAEQKCAQIEADLKRLEEQMAGDDFYTKTPRAVQQELLQKKEALEKALESALREWEDSMKE